MSPIRNFNILDTIEDVTDEDFSDNPRIFVQNRAQAGQRTPFRSQGVPITSAQQAIRLARPTQPQGVPITSAQQAIRLARPTQPQGVSLISAQQANQQRAQSTPIRPINTSGNRFAFLDTREDLTTEDDFDDILALNRRPLLVRPAVQSTPIRNQGVSLLAAQQANRQRASVQSAPIRPINTSGNRFSIFNTEEDFTTEDFTREDFTTEDLSDRIILRGRPLTNQGGVSLPRGIPLTLNRAQPTPQRPRIPLPSGTQNFRLFDTFEDDDTIENNSLQIIRGTPLPIPGRGQTVLRRIPQATRGPPSLGPGGLGSFRLVNTDEDFDDFTLEDPNDNFTIESPEFF